MSGYIHVWMKLRIQRGKRLGSNFRLLQNLFSLDDGRCHMATVVYWVQLGECFKMSAFIVYWKLNRWQIVKLIKKTDITVKHLCDTLKSFYLRSMQAKMFKDTDQVSWGGALPWVSNGFLVFPVWPRVSMLGCWISHKPSWTWASWPGAHLGPCSGQVGMGKTATSHLEDDVYSQEREISLVNY